MPAKKQTAPALPDSSSVAAPAEADGGTRRPRWKKGWTSWSAGRQLGRLAELAHRIDRSVSEIFRMAVTLQRRGYVQVDENDRYTLTLKMFELAHRQQPLKSLVSVALPLLRELASRARQSCHRRCTRAAAWSSSPRSKAPSAGPSA